MPGERINLGGNYCGHSPDSPSLSLPIPPKVGKGGLPYAITKLIEELAGYYWDPSKILPELDAANGSKRKTRSERREATLRLLAAIIVSTELSSLRVGYPTSEGFVNSPLSYLAQRAGLGMRRAERAMNNLKKAGFLEVIQKREPIGDGQWKVYVAVKSVTEKLWEAFGLGKKLKKAREYAAGKIRERNKKAGTKTTGYGGMIRMILGGAGYSFPGKRKREAMKAQNTQGEAWQKARAEAIGHLLNGRVRVSPEEWKDIIRQATDFADKATLLRKLG